MCLINLSQVLYKWNVLKVVSLTLVLSRKYRWPEHYFSVWSLENSQKLLTTNQFFLSTIFFTITNISFFILRFDLLPIIATKEVNQIRNNTVCVVAPLVYLFCYSLWAIAMLFNIFSYIKKNRSFTANISRLCYFLWLCLNLSSNVTGDSNDDTNNPRKLLLTAT